MNTVENIHNYYLKLYSVRNNCGSWGYGSADRLLALGSISSSVYT